VNLSGGHWGTALQAASFRGYLRIVTLLLERGADVNFSGGHWGTALQAASFSGQEEVVALLLERGADVNALGGKQYRTALQAAMWARQEAVVSLLLKNGARTDVVDDEEWIDALSAAVYASHLKNGEFLQMPEAERSDAIEGSEVSRQHVAAQTSVASEEEQTHASPGRRSSSINEAQTTVLDPESTCTVEPG
jgi:ankyrin repeat protein